ncbi:hypothetical protein ACWCV2_17010 [Streptomyces pseudogriseolus]
MPTATAFTPDQMAQVSAVICDLIGLHSPETDDALVDANNAVCDAWEAIEDATTAEETAAAQHAAQQAVSRTYAVISGIRA